jgi:tRNA/rRNA methyltransferase
VHFLYGEKADALMHAVRHLIGRAQPTRQEVKLLFGLARQLSWVAARLSGDERQDGDDGREAGEVGGVVGE